MQAFAHMGDMYIHPMEVTATTVGAVTFLRHELEGFGIAANAIKTMELLPKRTPPDGGGRFSPVQRDGCTDEGGDMTPVGVPIDTEDVAE